MCAHECVYISVCMLERLWTKADMAVGVEVGIATSLVEAYDPVHRYQSRYTVNLTIPSEIRKRRACELCPLLVSSHHSIPPCLPASSVTLSPSLPL